MINELREEIEGILLCMISTDINLCSSAVKVGEERVESVSTFLTGR